MMPEPLPGPRWPLWLLLRERLAMVLIHVAMRIMPREMLNSLGPSLSVGLAHYSTSSGRRKAK